MSLNLNDAGKGGKVFAKRPLPKAGTQAGRILNIVDLGTQRRAPYQGEEKKPARMIWMNFELPNSKFTLEDGKEVPHRISTRDMTFSNDPKAALFKILKSVDPDDTFKGDLSKLAGLPVLVTIVHAKVKQVDSTDITYANFGGVSLPPEGFPIPEASEAASVFSYDAPDKEVFDKLPSFVQEKIKNAIGYAGSKTEATLTGASELTGVKY